MVWDKLPTHVSGRCGDDALDEDNEEDDEASAEPIGEPGKAGGDESCDAQDEWLR